jgi:hypothetical protein
VWGADVVFALHLVACAVAYAALLGETPRRALRNGLGALVGAALVVLVASSVEGLAVGLACVTAFVRSGLEYSLRSGRGLVIEIALVLGGLAFASWLASPGWLGAAAALWGFALVQSLYFLVPGRTRARGATGPGDPFDRARQQILALLGEP